MSVGEEAEKLAADFLRAQGLTIAQTNYRCRFGEIDIIAQEEQTLVFVEVRFRQNLSRAAESIHRRKQQKLIAAAESYLASTGNRRNCRFDAILISPPAAIRWLKNAFTV